jgi:uncharacterized RDD family membrane protein YckC
MDAPQERTDAPNPYQPPSVADYEAHESVDEPFPASLGRRFGNYAIDGILVAVVAFGLAFALISTANGDLFEVFAGMNLGIQIAAYVLVYVLPEALLGRTLGKLCTGTKVVNLQGGKPSFGQVLARTAIRFVPFEPFSFLWGDATGWHDTWSKTRVVPVVEPYSDV